MAGTGPTGRAGALPIRGDTGASAPTSTNMLPSTLGARGRPGVHATAGSQPTAGQLSTIASKSTLVGAENSADGISAPGEANVITIPPSEYIARYVPVRVKRIGLPPLEPITVDVTDGGVRTATRALAAGGGHGHASGVPRLPLAGVKSAVVPDLPRGLMAPPLSSTRKSRGARRRQHQHHEVSDADATDSDSGALGARGSGAGPHAAATRGKALKDTSEHATEATPGKQHLVEGYWIMYANGAEYVGEAIWVNVQPPSARHGRGAANAAHGALSGTLHGGNGEEDQQLSPSEKLARRLHATAVELGDKSFPVPHGMGRFAYETKKRVVYGEWKHFALCGMGVEVKFGGKDTYRGSFLHNVRNGFGVGTYRDGSAYLGEWSAGVRSGVGRIVYNDGGVYSGEWVANQRAGRGEMLTLHGDYYVGEWAANVRSGVAHWTTTDGDVYFGRVAGNLRHGRGLLRRLNGEVIEGLWYNGRLLSSTIAASALDALAGLSSPKTLADMHAAFNQDELADDEEDDGGALGGAEKSGRRGTGRDKRRGRRGEGGPSGKLPERPVGGSDSPEGIVRDATDAQGSTQELEADVLGISLEDLPLGAVASNPWNQLARCFVQLPTGHRYFGDLDENGLFHGKGTMLFPFDDVIYEGSFVHGERCGKGTLKSVRSLLDQHEAVRAWRAQVEREAAAAATAVAAAAAVSEKPGRRQRKASKRERRSIAKANEHHEGEAAHAHASTPPPDGGGDHDPSQPRRPPAEVVKAAQSHFRIPDVVGLSDFHSIEENRISAAYRTSIVDSVPDDILRLAAKGATLEEIASVCQSEDRPAAVPAVASGRVSTVPLRPTGTVRPGPGVSRLGGGTATGGPNARLTSKGGPLGGTRDSSKTGDAPLAGTEANPVYELAKMTLRPEDALGYTRLLLPSEREGGRQGLEHTAAAMATATATAISNATTNLGNGAVRRKSNMGATGGSTAADSRTATHAPPSAQVVSRLMFAASQHAAMQDPTMSSSTRWDLVHLLPDEVAFSCNWKDGAPVGVDISDIPYILRVW